jgi:carboxylesterase type B
MYIGWTRDDTSEAIITGVTDLATYNAALKAKFGTDASAVFNLYPAFNDRDAVTQASRLINEHDKGKYMVSWARLQKMKGKSRVYVYRFDRPDSSGLAYHTNDVAYWFGNMGAIYGTRYYPFQTAADYELTDRMQDSLASWCKTGNPNTAYVTVPEYNPNDEKLVAFDANAIAAVPISAGLKWFINNASKY